MLGKVWHQAGAGGWLVIFYLHLRSRQWAGSGAKLSSFKVLPQWPTSYSTGPCDNYSAVIQINTTGWRPSVQTRKPVRDSSYSSHNRGKIYVHIRLPEMFPSPHEETLPNSLVLDSIAGRPWVLTTVVSIGERPPFRWYNPGEWVP